MNPVSIADLPARQFLPEQQVWSVRDTQLYALGLGVGHDPCDPFQLAFLNAGDPQVLPTQAAVLAASSDWMRDPANGIDATQLVALSHTIRLDRKLPARGLVQSRLRVTQVFDRGPGRGAVIHWHRQLYADGGERLATVEGRALARANGGFGGTAPRREPVAPPEGPPARTVTWPTHPGQALLYGLSGDSNPLHTDPDVARSAGFPRPVLHGLCSLGISALAVARAAADSVGDAWLAGISGRYAGVVYPGESLRVDVWIPAPTEIRFRCIAVGRQTPVIEDGAAWLVPETL